MESRENSLDIQRFVRRFRQGKMRVTVGLDSPGIGFDRVLGQYGPVGALLFPDPPLDLGDDGLELGGARPIPIVP